MGKDLKGKEIGEGIVQQSNGLYVGRFVDRSGTRRSKRSKSLQEVRRWLSETSYADRHSNLDNSTDMTVDAWFSYWIKIKEQTVRPSTVSNYRERYQHNIRQSIGNKRLCEIKPMHCQRIFSDMAAEGYRSTTIYQTRIALHNMLQLACDNDVIPSNPCKKSLKSNMGKPSVKKEALTVEVQRKFLNVIKGCSYENQYRFILQTGLRTGELIGLRWSDIDFKNKTMKISRTMECRYSVGGWRTGPPKSSAGYRTIPLTEEAVRILEDQKLKNSLIKVIPIEWSEYVFLCRKGTPVTNTAYNAILFRYCDKAGIPRFSMHVLRHTFATRCLEGSMQGAVLQRILGHSSIGITMNLYVHITDEEKYKEIERAADALKVI